jgi:hypothetical protein
VARCFCGCGRRVGFGQRPINTRGKHVVQRIGEADRVLGGIFGQSPTLERFIAEGIAIRGQLADAVHGGEDPGPTLEAWSRDWERQGRAIGSNPEAALGAAVSRSGLSSEEFASALVKHDFGDLDPFAWTLEAREQVPSPDELQPFVEELRRQFPDAERPHQDS